MKLTRFFMVQSALLGSCAFAAWALLGSPVAWPFSLSLDTLAGFAAGISVTAIFLLVVAWPAQLALSRSRSLLACIFVGLISGPIGVWLALLVISNYPVNWEWYVSRTWVLHVVYAGVGVAFAAAWRRRLRPNNSFKPNLLRKSA